MPLDVAAANTRTQAINEAFPAIGTIGATRMPANGNNREPVAWEYHLASHLLRIAETRRKRAHAATVKNAVMFDHEKAPMAVGTNALVWVGNIVEISVLVAAPIVTVDHAGLVADLLKTRVDLKLIKRLVGKNRVEMCPAHKFISALQPVA
jgi:hypothetical protein